MPFDFFCYHLSKFRIGRAFFAESYAFFQANKPSEPFFVLDFASSIIWPKMIIKKAPLSLGKQGLFYQAYEASNDHRMTTEAAPLFFTCF